MINLRQVSLAALVERDGIELHKQGREMHGACPFCGGGQHSDRFWISDGGDRDRFYCRQCQKGGDAITYLALKHGMSFGEAMDSLGVQGDESIWNPIQKPKTLPTTKTGIVIPESLDEPPSAEWQQAAKRFVEDCAVRLWTSEGEKALAYLRGRCLADETIRIAQIGFSPSDDYRRGVWRGITIPHYYGGELWAVNVRRSVGDPKYKVITGSKRCQLFNGDYLFLDDVQNVIVCGGEFDALVAQQFAPKGVAVVTFGSETKRVTWEVDYLLRGKRVLIAYDNDSAGDKGATQWAKLGERARVPFGKDITEFVQQGGDIAGWLAEIVGVADYSSELETAILEWLESKGYTPTFNDQGHYVANRTS